MSLSKPNIITDAHASPTETTIADAMKQTNAHVTVAKLCVEMAQEAYEEKASHDDKWYLANKTAKQRKKWVQDVAPRLRKVARQLLTQMLTSPHVPEDQKMDIWEAIVNDQTIPDGPNQIT